MSRREQIGLATIVGFIGLGILAAVTIRSLTAPDVAPAPAPHVRPHIDPLGPQPTPAPRPHIFPIIPRHDEGALPEGDVGQAAGAEAAVNGDHLFGYKPNVQGTNRFLATLKYRTLAEAGPDLLKAREERPVFLYRSLYKAYAATHGGQQWVVGRQGIGDCVSWGWAHGCDIHLAVMWELGDTAEWHAAATEAIYGGSRVEAEGQTFGGWGDGSYGGAAAKWVRDWGVVFRQDYPGLVDLTKYDSNRAKQWGAYGCGGRDDKGRLDAAAKKHPVRHVALVKTYAEAAAAIASGYPVPVCSGQGFTSTRDKDGFCRASGSWSHCMCFIGVRYAPRAGLLCLNSWGPAWVTGPKWPDDQPDGSFWVDQATAQRMLNGEDSFAVSGYEGFPYKDLKHGDWVELRLKPPPNPAFSSEQEYALAP